MGNVDQIYISKLNQVQSMLSEAASRAGFKAVRFSSILNMVESETQDTGASNTGINNYNTMSTVSFASNVSVEKDTAYDTIIEQAAQNTGIDANLLKAVIRVESSFNANAKSKCGAMGLMQLMPGTAKSLNVTDPYDPVQNINGGASYIKKQLNRFGDIRLALAAYNTGPGRVASLHITDPDSAAEYSKLSSGVRGYVDKVLSYYQKYANK